jgi:hypothetical protein
MRIIVLLFIVLILASLASALYYLIKDKGQSDRAVKNADVRVALSLTLFLCSWADITSASSRNGLRRQPAATKSRAIRGFATVADAARAGRFTEQPRSSSKPG